MPRTHYTAPSDPTRPIADATGGTCAPLHATVPAARAGELGIRVSPLARFAIAQRPPNGLAFGLGAIDAQRIRAGVSRLAHQLG